MISLPDHPGLIQLAVIATWVVLALIGAWQARKR